MEGEGLGDIVGFGRDARDRDFWEKGIMKSLSGLVDINKFRI